MPGHEPGIVFGGGGCQGGSGARGKDAIRRNLDTAQRGAKLFP